MNRKDAKILITRYEKEFSKDFHNIFTPFELCDEMINKIPELNKDMKILVMFNLEFLFVLQERWGKEEMKNVWFMTPCEIKKKVAVQMGVNENKVIRYEYNTKQIDRKDMPKFDVVVGNPPFKGTLHLDMLNIAYNMSSKYIIWVHPSMWLLDERTYLKKYEKFNEIKILLKDKIEELTLFNGNPYFNTGLFVPFVIDLINKEKENEDIKIIDKIQKKEYTSSIYNINQWANYTVYPYLKEKILTLSKEDSLYNHVNKSNGEWFVNISTIRGNVSSNSMKSDDFYSLITKDTTPLNTKNKKIWFSFKKNEHAENFIRFLKSRVCMFCLSIYKIDQNMNVLSIPWLDFSQEWTDEKLYKHFNLTEEEIDFIEINIPKYY